MNRLARGAAAAALAAALSVGSYAPAAFAAHAPHAAAKADHGAKGGKADHGAKGGKGAKADRVSAKVKKEIARKDKALVRVARKAVRLDAAVAEQVAANIAADRALLAGMTTERDVRGVRPEIYQVVIADLRLLAELGESDATFATSVQELVADVLGLGATSDRAELRAVKRAISALEELVEAAEAEAGETEAGETEVPESEVAEPGDAVTEQPTEPVPAV